MNLCPTSAARLALSYLRGEVAPPPECLLVLGGDMRRELLAASTWPVPVVLLSSGAASAADVCGALGPARAARTIVLEDRTAVDTVSNFTSCAAVLRLAGARSVAVATARAHMPRAVAIGALVLGSQGIWLVPCRVDTDERLQERWWRTARDALRAALWVLCGLDLAHLIGRLVHPSRFRDSSSWLAKRRCSEEETLGAALRAALSTVDRTENGKET